VKTVINTDSVSTTVGTSSSAVVSIVYPGFPFMTFWTDPPNLSVGARWNILRSQWGIPNRMPFFGKVGIDFE